jgi:prepilin-type N-terminal cleavage/methylation domain-containing protein
MFERFFYQSCVKFFRSQKGFSLIEIAVVLVIVGIVIGGVFQGRELIDKARLQKLTTMLNQLQMSVTHFREDFGYFPGDLPEAKEYLGGDIRGGNGDGILDGNYKEAWSEVMLFWLHLERSGKLPNIQFHEGHGRSPSDGFFLPKTPLGGMLLIQHNPRPDYEGPWLIIANLRGEKLTPLLTPAQAHFIDKTLDDGNPNTGHVRSCNSEGETRCLRPDEGGYNLTEKKAACITYISLEDR